MADRYWVNDDADNSFKNANNWAAEDGGAGGAGVPGSSDAVILKAVSSIDQCVVDVALDVQSITAYADYTGAGVDDGRFDNAAAHNITVGDVAFACKSLTLGNGATWTVNGNWDTTGMAYGTITRTGSLIDLAGTSKTFVNGTNGQLNDITVSGSYTSPGKCGRVEGAVRVTGTLTCNHKWVYGFDAYITGTLNGSGSFGCTNGKELKDASGTIDIATFELRPTVMGVAECASAVFGGNLTLAQRSGSNGTIRPLGDIEVGGTLTLYSRDHATYTFWIDMATNNVDLTVRGGVVWDEGTLPIVWQKGTGTITIEGANDQDIQLGDPVEDIVVNKSAGDLVLNGDIVTDSWTGTSTGTGKFKPNGYTITTVGACSWTAAFKFASDADAMNGCTWVVGGNWTADGQKLPATAAWYLQVTGTAVASGIGEVAYSDASGGTEINAAGGTWTDNGNNINWAGLVSAAPVRGKIGTSLAGRNPLLRGLVA